MAEKLTIFSTVEDLRRCSNDVLVAGIDSVGKEVILAYILELRERLKQAVLGPYLTPSPPSAPSAPISEAPAPSYAIATGMQEASCSGLTSTFKQASISGKPAELDDQLDENVWERKVAMFRSPQSPEGCVRADLHFINSDENEHAVDLIMIDFEGNEIVVKDDILPGQNASISTYFKHAYIAREIPSRKLLVFENMDDISLIYEPQNFGLSGANVISPYKDGEGLDEFFKRKYHDKPLLFSSPDYEEGEKDAAIAKSVKQGIKLKVKFQNHTLEVVELIWKDHHGNEVWKQDIKPFGKYKEKTFYTHRYIARDKITRQLRSFCFHANRVTVFEGHALDIDPSVDCSAYCEIRNLYDCSKWGNGSEQKFPK